MGEVKTAADFIDLLGGNTKVAELFRVEPNVVGNWRVRGLPFRHHRQVEKLLDAAGHSTSVELWRQRP